MEGTDFIEEGFLMAFAVVRLQAPDRNAQARFFRVEVFRVGGRASGPKRLAVTAAEDADVDVRGLDLF